MTNRFQILREMALCVAASGRPIADFRGHREALVRQGFKERDVETHLGEAAFSARKLRQRKLYIIPPRVAT